MNSSEFNDFTMNELSRMLSHDKDTLIFHLLNCVNKLEERISKIEKIGSDADRRRFTRTKIPTVNSSFCEIPLPTPKNDSSIEYKENYSIAIEKIKQNHTRYGFCPTAVNIASFKLFDISMGGCSLLNCDKELAYFLAVHRIYENCRIVTADQSEITISLEVMGKRAIQCFDGHEFTELVGIKFLEVRHQLTKNSREKITSHYNKKVISTYEYEILN